MNEIYYTMSDSGQGASDPQLFEETCGSKDMHQQTPALPPQPCGAEYTVEITTVHIPMFRPKLPFLEILRESGASGEVFTTKEIIHHVKNYILRHQLFDPVSPWVVHCEHDKLGSIFKVKKFTVDEAVPLILKNSTAAPDTCIKIRRQLVKRVASASHTCTVGASGSKQTDQAAEGASCALGPESTAIITSTTAADSLPEGQWEGDGTASSTSSSSGPSGSRPHKRQKKRRRASDGSDGGPSQKRRTSVNFQYSDGGDEVDGAVPFCYQVNMETQDRDVGQGSQNDSAPRVEEDSISVQYDSDHFTLEYELESSDHRSESEVSSHESTKDIVVVCRESDIEFWADYSDTEASSDVELSDADHWACDSCGNKNIPFFRHCIKCWSLRPGWLPDKTNASSASDLPSTSTLVKPAHKSMASSESSDDQQALQTRQHHLRPFADRGRRKIRVVSASSSGHNSDSLGSEEDQPGTSQEHKDDSGISSIAIPSSQEVEDTHVFSSPADGQMTSRGKGGGKWRGKGGKDTVAPASDVCVVCASRPKTGSIIHGNSGHQVCCYRCAKQLKRRSLPCPVCRRPIQKVIQNFIL